MMHMWDYTDGISEEKKARISFISSEAELLSYYFFAPLGFLEFEIRKLSRAHFFAWLPKKDDFTKSFVAECVVPKMGSAQKQFRS